MVGLVCLSDGKVYRKPGCFMREGHGDEPVRSCLITEGPEEGYVVQCWQMYLRRLRMRNLDF